ncbi:hypothetical protein CsatB_025134 [Cannabis sativa]
MASTPLLLSLSLCFLVLLHGCSARSRTAMYGDQNECQLNRLEAREPDHRVECEGGMIESWNPNHEQFQCAGVALLRLTIQPNGLHLPSYTNGPQLIHVIRGIYKCRFYIAGNPHQEFPQSMMTQQGRRYSEERRERIEEEKEQEGLPNNVFRGFSVNLIQEAFNVDSETARKIQNQDDFRGSIIRVEGKLDLVKPQRSRQEQEQEMRRQELQQTEREHARLSGRDYNGLEENICTMRLRESMGNPARADVFSPQAGRLTTVNSYNLPILSFLRLSAERGFLYKNAMYAPQYTMNAHNIIYAIRGSCRCQVVDNNGRSVFEGEIRQGQALTVPQNFAVVKMAEKEGFEWVSFKTNDRAQVNQLAGKISFMRAMPEDVIANSYQISREQARRLKYNREESSLFTTSHQGIRAAVTA